jgi:hypothetical protein
MGIDETIPSLNADQYKMSCCVATGLIDRVLEFGDGLPALPTPPERLIVRTNPIWRAQELDPPSFILPIVVPDPVAGSHGTAGC